MTASTLAPEGETAARPLRAGLYGRASKDPKKRGRSVEDQMVENRRVCASLGATIVDEYIDLDRSASRHAKKKREDFERLISDIEDGKIDLIVSWESSRVQRDLEVYVKLRNLCMRTGTLWCYNGTVYDMRKRSDRLVTGIMAQVAEDEADGIQERNARTVRLSAERGTPHGLCPYGYLRRYDPSTGHMLGQFPDPDAALVVQELFQRAAARQSLNSLHKWMQQHIPGVSRSGIKSMLASPVYIGIRRYQGGETRGTWEPIVEESVYRQVQRVLAEKTGTSSEGRIKHLLAGIANCGLCEDNPAVGEGWLDTKWVNGWRKYAHQPSGHVSVAGHKLDAYVEEALLTWLQSPQASQAFAPKAQRQDLEEASLRLERLRAQLTEGRRLAGEIDEETGVFRLSPLSLASMEKRLLPLIHQAEADVIALSSVDDPALDSLLRAEDIEAAWNRLVLEQQRHVIRRTMRIYLYTAPHKGVRSIKEGRVRLVFVGEPGWKPHSPLRSAVRRQGQQQRR